MYAVIKTGGKQYTVSPDDIITVERLNGEAGDTITLETVLMMDDGTNTTIGAPQIDGASVQAQIVEQGRGKKVIIFKKRRRQTYRRKKGHRQHQTVLRIMQIMAGGKKVTASKASAPAQKDIAPAAASAEEAPHTYAEPPKEKDNLKKMGGVGPKLEEALNALGFYTFAQIAAWTPENVTYVDARLPSKGRIERDNWVETAKALAAEKDTTKDA